MGERVEATGAYARFTTTEGEVIEARVGTSFLSVEQARANLRKEIPDWDFGKVQRATAAQWNAKLGMVSVEGATEDQRAEVYTGAVSRAAVSAGVFGVREILQRVR